MTPLLSKIGFCNHESSSLIGYSVSRFISTPQATGMMAVAYYSVANVMVSKRYYKAFDSSNNAIYADYNIHQNNQNNNRGRCLYKITGQLYEIFFGLFLCCPVTKYPIMHVLSVTGFTSSAYFHMILLESSPFFKSDWPIILYLLKTSGSLSILGMTICSIITKFNIKLPLYLFWSFECIGLSSFVLFMHISLCYLKENVVLFDWIHNEMSNIVDTGKMDEDIDGI